MSNNAQPISRNDDAHQSNWTIFILISLRLAQSVIAHDHTIRAVHVQCAVCAQNVCEWTMALFDMANLYLSDTKHFQNSMERKSTKSIAFRFFFHLDAFYHFIYTQWNWLCSPPPSVVADLLGGNWRDLIEINMYVSVSSSRHRHLKYWNKVLMMPFFLRIMIAIYKAFIFSSHKSVSDGIEGMTMTTTTTMTEILASCNEIPRRKKSGSSHSRQCRHTTPYGLERIVVSCWICAFTLVRLLFVSLFRLPYFSLHFLHLSLHLRVLDNVDKHTRNTISVIFLSKQNKTHQLFNRCRRRLQ